MMGLRCVWLLMFVSVLVAAESRHFHRTLEEGLEETPVPKETKDEEEARRKVNRIVHFLLHRYPAELFAVLEANAWPNSEPTMRRRAESGSPILEYGRVIKKGLAKDNGDKEDVLKPGSFRIMRRRSQSLRNLLSNY